jgi:hypothetical protein
MRFFARVTEKSNDSSDPWIICELEGKNQEDKQILTGRCTLILPLRSEKASLSNINK